MSEIKKLFAIILSISVLFSLAACGQANKKDETPAEKVSIRLAALKGPTGMGLSKLIKENQEGKAKHNYSVELLGDPNEMASKILSGSVDIAALPINLASTLYQKTQGNISLLGINTLGVLYVLEKGDTVKSVSDLKGKKIYATGKASTPQYILEFILSSNGIDPAKDVEIEYKNEHSELATLAASGGADIVMLPEPNVSALLAQNKGFRVALDLTEEWGKEADEVLVQGCIVASKSFIESNSKAVDDFLTEYKASVDFVNTNTDEAGELIAAQGILPSAEMAKKVIPNSNICLITGKEMKKAATGTLSVLFNANPKSIGEQMPDEKFFYKAQ